MKLKLNKDGSAVVRNGAPVYVMANGSEREIDGAAAWKLALSKHFETSPVMAGLKLPADMAASFFGDSFRLEGGQAGCGGQPRHSNLLAHSARGGGQLR